MPHGRAAASVREMPRQSSAGRVPARAASGGRKGPPKGMPDSPMQSRNRVGARPRTGPKAFSHTGTWDWIKSAACADADSTQFFPEDRHNLKDPEGVIDYFSEVGAVNDAYCASCPVRLDCADHAAIHKEAAGVWGGQGPLERGVWK